MVCVLGDIVSGRVTIRDYGAGRRNLKWDSPALGVFVYFGKHVEETGAGFVGTREVCFLFVCDVFIVI